MVAPTNGIQEHWHKDSNNWKFYAFYFNKKDERLLLSKRNPKYGVTLNFANPKSYQFLLVFFTFFGFIIYMMSSK